MPKASKKPLNISVDKILFSAMKETVKCTKGPPSFMGVGTQGRENHGPREDTKKLLCLSFIES